MAFKLLVLAAFVTIVAISHAQTTGASSGEGVGDILGLVTSIVPGPLRNIANKLVEIIKKLGDFLAGQENLDQLVKKVLNDIGAIVCDVLQMVVKLLQTLTGLYKLDKKTVDLCESFRFGGSNGGVSGGPSASTASGSL